MNHFKFTPFLVAFLFYVSSSLNAQEITFISIDSTVKGTKAELFLKAKSWLVSKFNSAKDVIQLEDKDAGKIIGKGFFDFECLGMMGMHVSDDKIWFTVTINVKDSKDRIIINEFIHEGGQRKTLGGQITEPISYGSLDIEETPSGMERTKKQFNRMKEAAKLKGEELIKSFNSYMNSNSSIIKDEF